MLSNNIQAAHQPHSAEQRIEPQHLGVGRFGGSDMRESRWLLLAKSAAALCVIPWATSLAQPQDSSVRSYRDAANGFGISYPGSWQMHRPKTALVVFKVGDIESGQGCTVSAHSALELKNVESSRAAKMMTPKLMADQLVSAGFTNVRVLESGLTKISNRDAFYVVVDSTLTSMGMSFPSRAIMVITNKSSKVFTLSCSSDVGDFATAKPMFVAILSTFTIDP